VTAMKYETKAQAEAAIAAARVYIETIERVERRNAHAPFVGHAYRIRTNYSMPSKPSDYWWVYTVVTAMDDDGFLSGWRFARDSHGKIEIEPSVERIYPHIYLRCKVSDSILRREFAKILKEAQRMPRKLHD
jgi:hypothetical protein